MRGRRLPGLDPLADEIAHELSKGSTRIVYLFGLLVAASEESFVEGGGADGVRPGELRDHGGDLFHLVHERVAGPVGNERPWGENQFNVAVEGICASPGFLLHPPFLSPDRRDGVTPFPSASLRHFTLFRY